MKFLIVTHATHILANDQVYSYAPYVREMNLWNANVDEVSIVAPTELRSISKIDLAYDKKVHIKKIPQIAFINFSYALKSLLRLPLIFWILFKEMRKADHIHLRCPGTIGLVGCIMQIVFPKKKKTAKYAGNWDPKASQPLSYKMQKWILSNTFLTKNMQVLVYGEWADQSKNIKPFFTASYWDKEKSVLQSKSFSAPYNFLFVGSLVEGKRPLYTIQLVEKLIKNGVPASLDIYGDGVLRQELTAYVDNHDLKQVVSFKGNQPSTEIKKAYKEAHFLVLASNSEGWPKVLAEAMFWGVIPVSTKVSCVPWMLDYGSRGVLLSLNLEEDKTNIVKSLGAAQLLLAKSEAAMQWSRNYTLDSFDTEITKLL